MIKSLSCQHPMIIIFIYICYLPVPMLVTLANSQDGILMICLNTKNESLDLLENGI